VNLRGDRYTAAAYGVDVLAAVNRYRWKIGEFVFPGSLHAARTRTTRRILNPGHKDIFIPSPSGNVSERSDGGEEIMNSRFRRHGVAPWKVHIWGERKSTPDEFRRHP
jgi:hypothetical protein